MQYSQRNIAFKFAIIIALFPVILLISCFMIFYIDPLRAAENALNDAFDELDSLF